MWNEFGILPGSFLLMLKTLFHSCHTYFDISISDFAKATAFIEWSAIIKDAVFITLALPINNAPVIADTVAIVQPIGPHNIATVAIVVATLTPNKNAAAEAIVLATII